MGVNKYMLEVVFYFLRFWIKRVLIEWVLNKIFIKFFEIVSYRVVFIGCYVSFYVGRFL